MSYENVNLESGHGLHHQVTRCIHEEEMRRDISAGAKFSQMMPEKAQPGQDLELTSEGLAADVRNVVRQGRGGLVGSGGTLSEGEPGVNASAVSAGDAFRQNTLVQAPHVRAENAASIACFGLEKPLESVREMENEDGVRRVSESRNLQFGESFLRRQRENVKAGIGGSVKKGLRMVKTILVKVMRKKETPVEEGTPVLEHGKEYLLDSYGRDGAYKQMSKGALRGNRMNEKA